ncbi:MAG TPA: hypothetical protein VF092_11975 [Longimicrobium sp.]
MTRVGLRRAAAVVLTLSCCLPGAPAAAQSSDGVILAVNAGLGALTAGGLRVLRGGHFRAAAVRGAVGGALVYGGKRLAVERWDGAGLAGRQVAAVGSSIVWNAGLGRAPLHTLALPVGPVRLYVRTTDGGAVQPKIDASAVVAMVLVMTEEGSHLDVERSLSSGALVFRRTNPREPEGWLGGATAGVISYLPVESGGTEGEGLHEVLGHERVHMIQHDQAFLFFSQPAEAALLGSHPVGRYLDLGLNVLALEAVDRLIPYNSRPWEREARLLSPRTTEPPTGGSVGFVLAPPPLSFQP